MDLLLVPEDEVHLAVGSIDKVDLVLVVMDEVDLIVRSVDEVGPPPSPCMSLTSSSDLGTRSTSCTAMRRRSTSSL